MAEPTPPAAPQPAPPPARPPAAPPAQPPAQQAEPVLVDGLTPDEESEWVRLSDKRAAALASKPGMVEVKIEPPHIEMQFGGFTIGNDWTAVPESALTPLAVAAADSGVTLTQKEA